jgi:preprotein translocase subunit SecG
MGTIISILIILVCLLLILIVLVQNSKGGGLASSFASSNQVMGVRKTGDFLEKATWTLAVSLLALCLISTAFNNSAEGTVQGVTTESATRRMNDQVGNTKATAPATKTVAPTVNTIPPVTGGEKK